MTYPDYRRSVFYKTFNNSKILDKSFQMYYSNLGKLYKVPLKLIAYQQPNTSLVQGAALDVSLSTINRKGAVSYGQEEETNDRRWGACTRQPECHHGWPSRPDAAAGRLVSRKASSF
jgi:hypothetical protein